MQDVFTLKAKLSTLSKPEFIIYQFRRSASLDRFHIQRIIIDDSTKHQEMVDKLLGNVNDIIHSRENSVILKIITK